MGASASGGMDALLGRETLAGLAANDNGGGGRRSGEPPAGAEAGLRLLRVRRPLHGDAGDRSRAQPRPAGVQPGLAARPRRERAERAGAPARGDAARERQRQRARVRRRLPGHCPVVGPGDRGVGARGTRRAPARDPRALSAEDDRGEPVTAPGPVRHRSVRRPRRGDARCRRRALLRGRARRPACRAGLTRSGRSPVAGPGGVAVQSAGLPGEPEGLVLRRRHAAAIAGRPRSTRGHASSAEDRRGRPEAWTFVP